ncbi:MAG TPA: hypothetical protein VGH71_05185 [Gammaproteobacteria bacterium]|jgi:hypothetical protein
MLSRVMTHWTVRAGALGALLLLFGCSSSKPYALVAQLPAGDHLVIGAITVNDGQCTAAFASLDWADFYKPSCKVVKDQSGFKSFNINGTQLDFGAGENGFKLLTSPPKLPAPEVAAAPAAGTAAGAKPAAAAKAAAPAPAAATAVPAAAATGEDFPSQWALAPYPGNQHLAGQAPGYLLASDNLVIQGGDATLDVTFKTPAYKPLHMFAIVTTNEKGDFRLVFNPHLTSSLTAGGNYDVSMVSEGEGISGTVWDSHGFDSWTPSLPTTWAVKSDDTKQ